MSRDERRYFQMDFIWKTSSDSTDAPSPSVLTGIDFTDGWKRAGCPWALARAVGHAMSR